MTRTTRTNSIALASMIAMSLAVVMNRAAAPTLDAATQTGAAAQTVPPLDADITPLTSKNIAGHRLWILLFDKTSMQLEDVQRASADAATWNAEKTPNVDVVAVAVIGSAGIQMLQDFTSNDAKVRRALAAFTAAPLDPGSMRRNDVTPDLDALSSDTRGSGLKSLCDALKQWPEKKEMLYFTSGAARGDADTQTIYRDALSTCDKAHVTIDPIDARGLMAMGRAAPAPGRGGGANGSAGQNGGGGSSNSNGSGSNAGTNRSGGNGAPVPSRGANSAATRPDRLPPAAPGFSGTWQSDRCSTNFAQSPAALWLGQTFTSAYAPADMPTSLSFQSAPPRAFGWNFSLTGASIENTAAPLAGNWTSNLSWNGDKLVLAMAGSVMHDGKSVPVVTTHVLSFVTDEGARKGELQVVTSSMPSGLMPDGVCTYKKIG